ncbi:FHA domain-containing protein [Kribbella sp. DT2]|uniref:FHA domain-containing protein n=1 Tax=Kribbella sp. DT2 TaxID=3393427 RepID=UPI003CE8EF25
MKALGHPLPPEQRTLEYGVPNARPGTIFVLTVHGGIQLAAGPGRAIVFGRNAREVNVCIGGDDQQVSRRHGEIAYQGTQWWVTTAGAPLRVRREKLFAGDEPYPLAAGYTQLFVPGSGDREHLLEVYVVSEAGTGPKPRHEAPTIPRKKWTLSAEERLVLTVVGERYLLQEPAAQPVAWRVAAGRLNELQENAEWNERTVARLVERVRLRLHRGAVKGLTREEVGEPVGNTLNHNLFTELLESATLTPADLTAVDDD